MTNPLVLGVALLALGAAPAHAAGLSLTWDRCATNVGATSDKVFDCANVSSYAELFAVFNPPANANLLALYFSIDLQSAGAALPDFWRLTMPLTVGGSCNDDVHVTYCARPSSFYCTATSPWEGSGSPAECRGAAVLPNIGYVPGMGGPNRARLAGALERSSTTDFPVVAGTNYFAFHLDFYMSSASEAGGACAGCSESVAIVWNSAEIFSFSGESVPITGAGLVGNCATVNGATSICAATPARNRTWGALKSLYR
jgi:hypothetical protein